jgi:hypothetical protein
VTNVRADDSATKSETRHLPAFKDLEIDCSADTTFSLAPTTAVTITAPANILPLLLTRIEGDKLVVRRKKVSGISLFSSLDSSEIKLAITGPSLRSIAVPGSGSVKAPGLSGEKIDLNVSGSGSIDASGATSDQVTLEVPGSGEIKLAAITAKSVKISVQGSGRVRAGGTVEHVDGSIDGSGEIEAGDLKAQSLDVDISGSGNLNGFAAKAASVQLSGSGDVTIAGNPAQRHSERTGSGDITFK